jgi:hypothetical protein
MHAVAHHLLRQRANPFSSASMGTLEDIAPNSHQRHSQSAGVLAAVASDYQMTKVTIASAICLKPLVAVS